MSSLTDSTGDVGVSELDDELLASVFDEDADDAPVAAPVTSEPPTGQAPEAQAPPQRVGDNAATTPTATDAAPAASKAPEPALPPASPPSSADTPPTFVPPTGGKPWELPVDGHRIPIDGAQVFESGVWIPKQALERQLLPNYLGDRRVWRDERARLARQIEEAQGATSQRELEANAFLRKIAELDAKGVEGWAEWLDGFHQNRPILEAEVKRAAAEARLTALERQEQEQQAAVTAQETERTTQQHLGTVVEQLLAEDDYASLKGESVELLRELWEEHRHRFYFPADRDYPAHGIRKGEQLVDYDAIRATIGRRASQVKKQQQQIEELKRTTARNTEVLKAAEAPPPPSKARDDKGRFTEQSKEPVRKSRRQFMDDLMEEDWSDALTA